MPPKKRARGLPPGLLCTYFSFMALKYSAKTMLLSISRDNCLLINDSCLLIITRPSATVREKQRILIRISVMFDIILLFFFIYQNFNNNFFSQRKIEGIFITASRLALSSTLAYICVVATLLWPSKSRTL